MSTKGETQGTATTATALERPAPIATPREELDTATSPRRLAAGLRLLRPGDNVDHYVVVDVLGKGGMGQVLAAYDSQLERRVAIKVLLPKARDANDAAKARGRLLREAKAMARFQHENVVTVHGVGTTGDQVYIAMELMPGGTLGQWLRKNESSWQEVVAMFAKAGEGLAASHRAHLVHRDFKPENVLLGDRGRVAVTDFGLVGTSAEFQQLIETGAHAGSDMTLTATGTVRGTPHYMAPEQFLCRPVDARADQFAFCAALWEALYGKLPFAGRTFAELSKNVVSGCLDLDTGPSPVPTHVRTTLLRGLSTHPNQRFDSMDELLTALRSAPAHNRRRWPVMTSFVATASVAVAVGFFLEHRGWRADDDKPQAMARVVASTQPPADTPALALPPTALPTKVDSVTLRITSSPSGAQVYRAADGIKLGITPLKQVLAATDGAAVFVVKHTGYADKTVELRADMDGQLHVALAQRTADRKQKRKRRRRSAKTTAPKPRPAAQNRRKPTTVDPGDNVYDPVL